ncbi:unnamed protein product [Caenorhabditis angaria]|uniref:Uncharacterized protein n=1 Tax=Caenorhabditis angaria TaxID=860376 RepID=A0A9P1J4L8_9PELO|nr:unnamed protein product [Caenorhabditis angaria]
MEQHTTRYFAKSNFWMFSIKFKNIITVPKLQYSRSSTTNFNFQFERHDVPNGYTHKNDNGGRQNENLSITVSKLQYSLIIPLQNSNRKKLCRENQTIQEERSLWDQQNSQQNSTDFHIDFSRNKFFFENIDFFQSFQNCFQASKNPSC